MFTITISESQGLITSLVTEPPVITTVGQAETLTHAEQTARIIARANPSKVVRVIDGNGRTSVTFTRGIIAR